MPPNPTGPTNKQTRVLIRFLKKAANVNSAKIWRAIAAKLEKPRRQRVVVNVGKLERLVEDGDVVVVPGKLLGGGVISRKVTVAAFRASPKAIKKVRDAGGEVITIPELIRRFPKGKGVKVIT